MEQNYYKEVSTNQANQLRIALITIAVALTAFLSEDINNSIVFKTITFQCISVVVSTLAVISGLLAWNFSAKMFYDMGNGISYGLNHKLKTWFDRLLVILLSVAIITSAIYLIKEREPSHNQQIQPTSEIYCGEFSSLNLGR